MISRISNYIQIFVSFYSSVAGVVVLLCLVAISTGLYVANQIVGPSEAWIQYIIYAVSFLVLLFAISYFFARLQFETRAIQQQFEAQLKSRMTSIEASITALNAELAALDGRVKAQSSENKMLGSPLNQRVNRLEVLLLELRRSLLDTPRDIARS